MALASPDKRVKKSRAFHPFTEFTMKTPEQYAALTLTSQEPRVMAFPNLVVAKAPPLRFGRAKPQFSVTFLLDAEGDPIFAAVMRLSLGIVKSEFPVIYADAVKEYKAAPTGNPATGLVGLLVPYIKFPFVSGEDANEARRQEEKNEYPWAPGKILFKASSGEARQPALGSVETGKGVRFDPAAIAMNAGKFFHGAEAFFEVLFASYLVDSKRYVKAYLQKVYITGKGSRLGGDAGSETFDKYVGGVSNLNPVGDDDIPF